MAGRTVVKADNLKPGSHPAVQRQSGGAACVQSLPVHHTGFVAAPFIDFNLRTTNGSIIASNLFSTGVSVAKGPVDLYSARWSTVTENPIDPELPDFTNNFFVTFANAGFATVVAPVVIKGQFHTRDLVISDVITVLSNLLLDVDTLTITTNGVDAANPVGVINILSPNIWFPDVTPRLRTLTNYGIIQSGNIVYFQNQTGPYRRLRQSRHDQ